MTGYVSRSFAPERRLSREECFALTEHADLDALMRAAPRGATLRTVPW